MDDAVLSGYIGGAMYIMEKKLKSLEESRYRVATRIPDKGGMCI